MKLEEKLAMKIGALVVENAKKDAIIEALGIELEKRNAIIKKLSEIEPDLPLGDNDATPSEARNGAH